LVHQCFGIACDGVDPSGEDYIGREDGQRSR